MSVRNFQCYIPDYKVVVLMDSDNRSYAEVESDILSRKLQTKLQKIESEPEESFASAEKRTLNQISSYLVRHLKRLSHFSDHRKLWQICPQR